jgi:hypothetical protein
VGLFGQKKMSEEAGQWSSMAMACMVFADGSASEGEITTAHGQVTANPVLHESIGSREAERIFKETVAAIAQIPSAMLPTYELKLKGLSARIRDPNEKNFCFTTVIAIAMSDRTLTQSEHQMLLRFREMLGAAIPVPDPGAPPTPEVKSLQPVQPTGAAPGCATCGRPTQLYPGRGAWCANCQRFSGPPGVGVSPAHQALAQAPVSQSSPQFAQQHSPPPSSGRGPISAQHAASPNAPLGTCPRCHAALVPYQGYGPYCTNCHQVVR